MGYRIGIDVGGTFTDFALYDEDTNTLRIGKRLTTPHDPSLAVLSGLDDMLNAAGIGIDALTQAIHATTIAANTVVERKGPPTALLTTQGFRDVLIIGRQKRWELYDNFIDKPAPPVPRQWIWEVPERLLYDGTVDTPLADEAVRRAALQMREAGIQGVGICFLHNPSCHLLEFHGILRFNEGENSITLSEEGVST